MPQWNERNFDMEKINLNSRGFSITGSGSDIRNYNTAYSDYAVMKHNIDGNAHTGLISEVKAYTDEASSENKRYVDDNVTVLNSAVDVVRSELQLFEQEAAIELDSETQERKDSDDRLKSSRDAYCADTDAALEDNRVRIAALEAADVQLDEKLELIRTEFSDAIGESWEAEV